MYVICGQRDSLKQDINNNLRVFITRDLTWFQLLGLAVNVVILIIFIFIFERRLHNRVTKPIQSLTNSIKNPKEFGKGKRKDKKKQKKNKKHKPEQVDTDEREERDLAEEDEGDRNAAERGKNPTKEGFNDGPE